MVFLTESVYRAVDCVKVADTLLVAFIATTQEPVPEHAPPQPLNCQPESGVAVRVTLVPPLYVSEQSVPHVIPAGLLVMVPEPDLVTESKYRAVDCVKVADTLLAAFIATTQEPVPEHAPPQPEKDRPVTGVAVRVTVVPSVKLPV